MWVMPASITPSRAKPINGPLVVLAAGCLCLLASGSWNCFVDFPTRALGDQLDTRNDGKNSVAISGSDNTVSIGHIAGAAIPGAELILSNAVRKRDHDGSFLSIFDAQVVTPYTLGSLRLEAWASGIETFTVVAQPIGMSTGDNRGMRPDYAFTTVMNPLGQYKIFVVTAGPTDVEIRYAFY
jgi:hypothetical protein